MSEVDKPSRVFTLVPGVEVLEAVKTPEGAQALYEDICRALGITPAPAPPLAASVDGCLATPDPAP